MKLLNRPIDMISWTSKDGTITPVRFRMEEEGKTVVIPIGKILQRETNLFGGRQCLVFRCTSTFHGTEKIYELTYISDSRQWRLKKL